MKKKQQADCPYCHDIDPETPLHLFVECPIVKSLWNKVTKWCNATCKGSIARLEQNEKIYGVLKHTSSGLILNHLIITGKYSLHINAVHEKTPQFTDVVTLVNEKLELEKYIQITTNKLLSFDKNGPIL